MKTYAYTLITALTIGMLVSGVEAGCRGGRCGVRKPTTVSRTTAATKRVVQQQCTKKKNCQCRQCKQKRTRKPACTSCCGR